MARAYKPPFPAERNTAAQEALVSDQNHHHFLRAVGQFGGHSWDNVKAFVERVDNEKNVTAISS